MKSCSPSKRSRPDGASDETAVQLPSVPTYKVSAGQHMNVARAPREPA